jgi:hypothetical protein
MATNERELREAIIIIGHKKTIKNYDDTPTKRQTRSKGIVRRVFIFHPLSQVLDLGQVQGGYLKCYLNAHLGLETIPSFPMWSLMGSTPRRGHLSSLVDLGYLLEKFLKNICQLTSQDF